MNYDLVSAPEFPRYTPARGRRRRTSSVSRKETVQPRKLPGFRENLDSITTRVRDRYGLGNQAGGREAPQPFTVLIHAIREKHLRGRGLRPKVTDFLDGAGSPAIQFARSVPARIGQGALPASLATIKRSQSSPLAGASAFATPDAAKSAILRDFAVHAKLPCSVPAVHCHPARNARECAVLQRRFRWRGFELGQLKRR